MKKILFLLLCTVSIYGQTSTGQEQEFDYGIKNNSTQTITTPPYLTTTGMDGTQGKIPSALIEKTDNKQNSLAVDGTGTKYPTVDAINTGLALKANDSNVIHKTGNETKTGTLTINNPVGGGSYFIGTQSGSGNDRFLIKLFNNGSVNSSALKIDNQSDAYGINLVNISAGIGSYIGNNSNGTGFKIDNSSIGVGLILNNGASATGYPFVIAKNNIVKSYINDSGDVNGVKFVKTGGTSSQFLKADGSIDSTVYAPSTGGTGYIQNQNASAQSANMWISGDVKARAGTFSSYVDVLGTVSGGNNFIANTGGLYFNGYNNYNAGIFSNTSGTGLSFQTGGDIALSLAPSGAATFSSTVTATSFNGSATLTGTPTAPTAVPGTNTTQIATTAFVQSNSRPYKVYTALISQTGTNAPTATVLENTLGGTVVWSRSQSGVYLGTLTGAFTLSKTFASHLSGSSLGFFMFNRISSDVVELKSATYLGALSDSLMNNNSFEIRVYN